MSNPVARVEYMVRVKLPSSYERDYNDAIFAVKPEGFEVSWGTKNLWPIDRDGRTWVLLYCTDQKKAVEYFMDRAEMLEKKLEAIRKIGKQISEI